MPASRQEEADARMLAWLDERGQLEKREPYRHSVALCERCETRIEPLISLQWWCAMDELKRPALRGAARPPRPLPPRVAASLRHRVARGRRPTGTSRASSGGDTSSRSGTAPTATSPSPRPSPSACAECGSPKLRREEDVLDTWFSSALWPFATLGWPDETPDLRGFYPGDLNTTAREIIRLWENRMIFAGLELMGDVPFEDVIIHSTVLAPDGRRMSKSLGTGIDPLDVIEPHGADATRYGLLKISSAQDVRFSDGAIEEGRKLANKLWNASRLILLARGRQRCRSAPARRRGALDPRAARARRASRSRRASRPSSSRRAVDALYHLIFDDFCDWYAEAIKPRLHERRRRRDRDGARGARAAAEAAPPGDAARDRGDLVASPGPGDAADRRALAGSRPLRAKTRTRSSELVQDGGRDVPRAAACASPRRRREPDLRRRRRGPSADAGERRRRGGARAPAQGDRAGRGHARERALRRERRRPRWSRPSARSSRATGASSMRSTRLDRRLAGSSRSAPGREEFGLERMRALLAAARRSATRLPGDPRRRHERQVDRRRGRSRQLLAPRAARSARYLSPHVRGWSERIRIDGAEADFERARSRACAPRPRRLGATQFEALTAAALAEFAASGRRRRRRRGGARRPPRRDERPAHARASAHERRARAHRRARRRRARRSPPRSSPSPGRAPPSCWASPSGTARAPRRRRRVVIAAGGTGAREAAAGASSAGRVDAAAERRPARAARACAGDEIWDGAHTPEAVDWLLDRFPTARRSARSSPRSSPTRTSRRSSRRSPRWPARSSRRARRIARALPARRARRARAGPALRPGRGGRPTRSPPSPCARSWPAATARVLVTGSLYLLADLAAVRPVHAYHEATARRAAERRSRSPRSSWPRSSGSRSAPVTWSARFCSETRTDPHAPGQATTSTNDDIFGGSTTSSSSGDVARRSATSRSSSCVVFWLARAYWVYKDARRRIEDPWLVAVASRLGLVPPFLGAVIYMLFRPPEYLEDVRERELEIRAMEERLARADERCPVCRAEVEPAFLVCPVCTTRLKQACRHCKRRSRRSGRSARTARRRSSSADHRPRATPGSAEPPRGRDRAAGARRVDVDSTPRHGRREDARPDQARRRCGAGSPARSSRASSGAASRSAAAELVQVDEGARATTTTPSTGRSRSSASSSTSSRSGPTLALVLEGEAAISVVRTMMGATNPRDAAPGTIRGDYALDACPRTSCTARTRRRVGRARDRALVLPDELV